MFLEQPPFLTAFICIFLVSCVCACVCMCCKSRPVCMHACSFFSVRSGIACIFSKKAVKPSQASRYNRCRNNRPSPVARKTKYPATGEETHQKTDRKNKYPAAGKEARKEQSKYNRCCRKLGAVLIVAAVAAIVMVSVDGCRWQLDSMRNMEASQLPCHTELAGAETGQRHYLVRPPPQSYLKSGNNTFRWWYLCPRCVLVIQGIESQLGPAWQSGIPGDQVTMSWNIRKLYSNLSSALRCQDDIIIPGSGPRGVQR